METRFITTARLLEGVGVDASTPSVWHLVRVAPGEGVAIVVQPHDGRIPAKEPAGCQICGWRHDRDFTQIKLHNEEMIVLRGILPEIVRLVHQAHEKGFPRLSTKDGELLKICGGYRNPCKAFGDLNHQADYQRFFDTRRRGFISLRRTLA